MLADLLDDLAGDAPAAEPDRAPLRDRAVRVLHVALDVVERDLARDADLRDAAEVVSKIHRIVEHADRVELAKRGPALALVHINIGTNGQIAARVERDGGAAEVLPPPEPAATVTPAPDGAFAFEFEPLAEEGGNDA